MKRKTGSVLLISMMSLIALGSSIGQANEPDQSDVEARSQQAGAFITYASVGTVSAVVSVGSAVGSKESKDTLNTLRKASLRKDFNAAEKKLTVERITSLLAGVVAGYSILKAVSINEKMHKAMAEAQVSANETSHAQVNAAAAAK